MNLMFDPSKRHVLHANQKSPPKAKIMTTGEIVKTPMTLSLEEEIAHHLAHLFPVRRSITGDGNRQTLAHLSSIAPMKIHEVSSGTEVFDWRVPQEWRAEKAWVEDREGNRLVDYDNHPLHLVNYSMAVDRRIDWEELDSHLFVHPELPDAIPYRTSYYEKSWGFCVSQNQREVMRAANGPFHVVVDSEHFDGSLSYGEILLPGTHDREFLISSYICHPQMANDGVSGMLLTALLARALMSMPKRRWSYRIIFVPETIGAIAYCHRNSQEVKQLHAGLEITTVGGPGSFGLKQSWDQQHLINDVLRGVLNENQAPWEEYPFDIHGADERQFSSQAFRVNVATISKDRYYEFPEYHSSADDLSLVTPDQLMQSLNLYLKAIDKLEEISFLRSKQPSCEVMMSKHDLYPKIGGAIKPVSGVLSDISVAMWLLFYLDGRTPISSIARDTGIASDQLKISLSELIAKGIVEEV